MIENTNEIVTTVGVVLALLAGKEGSVLFWNWVKAKVTADLEARVEKLEKKES